jgi:hypothetical protein
MAVVGELASPRYDTQEVLCAYQEVTLGTGNDIAATGEIKCINVPANAIVVGGWLNVSDATTASVDIHVGDGGSTARYLADVDGAATGLSALVPTGYKYTTADTIDLMIDTAAPAAAGQVELCVYYIVVGRACHQQPPFNLDDQV